MGCHTAPPRNIHDHWERLARTPDTESDVGSRQTAGQSPDRRADLIYISWYINGYGRPRTLLDVNSNVRYIHGQFAGSAGALLPTTNQMANSRVPSAAQYPRRGT